MKGHRVVSVALVALMTLSSGCLWGEKTESPTIPTSDLYSDYMVLVDEPTTVEEMALITLLSVITAREGEEFHPIFILEDGQLDAHSLWTIEHLQNNDVPKYLFTASDATALAVIGQVDGVERFGFGKSCVNGFIKDLLGYEGTITVGSFKEALWVAPLAKVTNQTMILGASTYSSQEEVWEALSDEGVDANYILVTNPDDLSHMGGWNPTDGSEVSYHIPALSALGGHIAAWHSAYVVTDVLAPAEEMYEEWEYVIPPDLDETPDFDDSTLLDYPMGLLQQLRDMDDNYGPIENIALLGSAEAVPQWELLDRSNSEPDYTSSDVLYGFLDFDHASMDVPVGRFINWNVQGMANQVTRTFCYERFIQDVTVTYADGDETYPWRTTGADLNGFEVADMRLQNTPGLWVMRDYEDEGFDAIHYVSTAGIGLSGSDDWVNIPTDADLKAYLESSGHTIYRGHGSWHGGFYTWRYYGPGVYKEGHVEGSEARNYFLPPQSSNIFSCENTKIHGLGYGGEVIDMDRDFAVNWMYAGAVGLIGATEVSYSNIGQDVISAPGVVTGEYNWDKNNLWFAGSADGTLDHETTLGQTVMNTENRYLSLHPEVSPVHGGDADWKEVVMFTLLGDPAFTFHITSPGPNDYDPWH